MQQDPNFARFLLRREELGQRFDETCRQLDAWIADWLEVEPPSAQLAYLEGLLQVRSDLFSQLKAIDDELRDYLLALHQPS